ncbi:MAG: IS5 family transposase [Roseiflexaceae bacterium]
MAHNIDRKHYKSDLTDEEWFLIAPLVAQQPGPGRKRTISTREVVNAIFYLNKTGCQREALPHDFPDYKLVNYHYLEWTRSGVWDMALDMLRELARVTAGKEREPTAAIMDSQSVKTTGHGEARGYDAGKQVKGRKRHIMVDTLGCLLLVMITSASVQDRDGGLDLCVEIQRQLASVKKIWADQSYARALVDLVRQYFSFALEIISGATDQQGFQVQPKRWIVERTFGWLNPFRRLSKDYENTVESSESMVKIANIRLMLRRVIPALYAL